MNCTNIPLCIDLDGTLIQEDITFLSFKQFLKKKPLNIFKTFWWFIQGRANLKKKLALSTSFETKNLKFNVGFLDWLNKEFKQGRDLYLVTAADEQQANKIAKYLGIFKKVWASNGEINLRRKAKAKKLIDVFGVSKFIYVGNSFDDLKVWQYSAKVIAVKPSKLLLPFLQKRKAIIFWS